ncbi:MAG: hypothetical protein HY717_21455 [Planctomycetes bacterium]|nr:hypothetical protein [Planctomycetota bacterium]
MLAQLWSEERELQRKALAAVFSGEAVRAEDLESWSLARERMASELGAAGRAEAAAAIDEQVLLARVALESLEDQPGAAAGIEKGSAPPFLEALLLGERLRWLRRLCGRCLGEPGGAPFEFIQAEVHRIASRARELAELQPRLGEAVRPILEGARAASAQIRGLLADRWLEEAGKSGPDQSSPRERFQAAWQRVLGFHEQIAPLDPDDRQAASRREALRSGYENDLAACHSALPQLEAADLEGCLLKAVCQLEEHASTFLSEGDLQEAEARIAMLHAAVEAIDDFEGIIRPLGPRLFKKAKGSSPTLLDFQREHRRLLWVKQYARRTIQTLELEAKLEEWLGRRRLRRFENAVFGLILILVLLVAVEWRLDASGALTPAWAWAFQLADLGICSVLLGDFFLRWAVSGWAGWFLRRHFVFDFLPALPYGFLFSVLESLTVSEEMLLFIESARVLLFIRVLRAVTMGIRTAQPFLRAMVPFLRLFRLLVFLVRGSDRIVHYFRGLLDSNVLLFEEQAQESRERPLASKADRLHGRQLLLVRDWIRDADPGIRPGLLHGYLHLLRFEAAHWLKGSMAFKEPAADRTVYLETLIDTLVNLNALSVEEALGQNGASRLAKLIRWIDFPLLRHLPILRRWVPAARRADPLEAVAAAARELGRFFQRILAFFHAWGDLSGITTGPQILDRLATAMIRTTQRPMVRLIIFGGLFILFNSIVESRSEGFLAKISEWLNRIVGLPLFVLGSICLIVNFTGRWFKRISGEALDFYLRTSEAHFFSLLRDLKARRREEDLEEIRRRVLIPECRLRGCHAEATGAALARFRERLASAAGAGPSPAHAAAASGEGPDPIPLEPEAEHVALLYRDYLNGTPLQRTDDKSSMQLLGNLAMRDIRTGMLLLGKKERRRLEKLALEKDRLLGLGPYIWFRFISESMAIETAKLTLEYNSSCIPLLQLESAHPEQRRRFENFLKEKREVIDPAARRARRSQTDILEAPLITTYFHSLHFLSENSGQDLKVEEHFGTEVMEAMIRDRRAMVRDIFGTWPYHLLPRRLRRFNFYRLYFRYLGGAKVFLFPFFLLGQLLGLFFRGFANLVRIVREVLGKVQVKRSRLSRVAGFDVAVRKINRMRKPYFMEAMHLRAAVDLEYFGIRIPGAAAGAKEYTYLEDLEFIGALEPERQYFEELRRSHLKNFRRLRSFLAAADFLAGASLGGGEAAAPRARLNESHPEVLRAVAAAFITDQYRLRSLIVGPQEIVEFFERALAEPPTGPLSRLLQSFCHHAFWRLWPSVRRRGRLFERFFEMHPHFQNAPRRLRAQARRAFLRAAPATARHCAVAVQKITDLSGYQRAVADALDRVVREHSLWSEKLITLRTIQTLTILDIRSYRELVRELGGYDSGEEEKERRKSTSEERN